MSVQIQTELQPGVTHPVLEAGSLTVIIYQLISLCASNSLVLA